MLKMEQLQKDVEFILKKFKITRLTCEFCKEEWLSDDTKVCVVCNVKLHPYCSSYKCGKCKQRYCSNHFKLCNDCEGYCQQCLFACQCCPCHYCYECDYNDDIESCSIHKTCNHL